MQLRYVGLLLVCVPVALVQGESNAPPSTGGFPLDGLLPKQETQAAAFLKKYPDCDGRGVTVAVLDTGVDPGAAGLQHTSDGRPKIIDLIDGTGSGDVQMTIQRESHEGHVTGLSGRRLKLDPQWVSRNGKFRVGCKAGYSFFPPALLGRCRQARRREFDTQQRELERQIEVQLQAARASDDHKRSKVLADRQRELISARGRYRDPGPLFDCLTFHNGVAWQAVIDTDEDGDLTDEVLLTDFHRQRQFATFPAPADLNFAVNIYDAGRVLSIVTDSGSHGTHVAGIIGGFHPHKSELNGVAPGVQIVSVKIGDPRLGGMETATALLRAARAVMRHKCDMVNMSFGEPTRTPNQGFLIREFTQLVDDFGVLFVASAGNSGPALGTVGAPGGTSSAVLGVGAYVSPSMMSAAYALPQTDQELAYTWTSRGPTADGDLGVDVMAPGGAVSSVPSWTRNVAERKNGTSMAAPNACGCLALLISAARTQSLSWSPSILRRAIQNTARTVKTADVFSQGAGLIQVQAAFDYLKSHANRLAQRLAYDVQVQSSPTSRGVFLCQPHQTQQATRWSIRVRPRWSRNAEPAVRRSLQLYLDLQSNVPWVRCGQHLVMNGSGQTFQVEVDPTQLNSGVHFGEICARVHGEPEEAVVFRVPFTIVRSQDPAKLPASEQLQMTAGALQRRFYQVPDGATVATLKLTADSLTTSRRMVVHAVSHTSRETLRQHRYRQYLTLRSGATAVRTFPVRAGEILEVCLGQYWSSTGPMSVKYELQFDGVSGAGPLVIGADALTTPVELRAGFGRQSVEMRSRLTHCRTLLPVQHAQRETLLTARDQVEGQPTLQRLTLSYELVLARDQTIRLWFPPAVDQLYGSQWGGYVCHVWDANQRRLFSDDVFPDAHHLQAGTYTVKLQLLASGREGFATVEQSPLAVERQLKRKMELALYASRSAALSGRRPVSQVDLAAGQQACYFLARPDAAALSDYQPGDTLVGTLELVGAQEAVVNRALSVECVVPPHPRAAKTQEVASRPSEEQAIQLLKLDRLRSFPLAADVDDFERAFQEFDKEYPRNITAHAARLEWLDAIQYRKQRLPLVVSAADDVLKLIDNDDLARDLGLRTADAQTRRDRLAETLYRKGRALGYMELPDVIQKFPIADPVAHNQEFEQTFAELQRWVDTTQRKYVLLHVRRDRRRGRLAAAVVQLHRLIDQEPENYWYFKKLRDVYGELGWSHLHRNAAAWLVLRYPNRLK